MMEQSQYPEVINDSDVPDDTIDFDAPNPGEGIEVLYQNDVEDYDDGDIRELNRRSGKGVGVIMAVIALLAIAGLAAGSALLVQKNRNRSIEAAQQSANASPPTPSPTPSSSVDTYTPTINETQANGIPSPNDDGGNSPAIEEDIIDGIPVSTPTNSTETGSPTIAGTSILTTPTSDLGGATYVLFSSPSSSPVVAKSPSSSNAPIAPNNSSAILIAVPSIAPTTLPGNFPSNEPTCDISIAVEFVTEERGNLDKVGFTLMSVSASNSTTYMEVLPGELKDYASHNDIVCVKSGAYTFNVYDDSYNCCGDDKGYYAVMVNGDEVVRMRSYFTSPNAYVIRTDYQPPTTQEADWLNKHNDARKSFHTDNDVSFAPLVWSESLTQSAADRANDIARSCRSESKTMDPWGENIARTTSGGYNEAFVGPDYVFNKWGNSNDHPFTFRQIMWRPSRYVGCATNITYTEDQYCHIAVCKYARPGNCNVNDETWLNQTLEDYSKCGPPCPDEGCY